MAFHQAPALFGIAGRSYHMKNIGKNLRIPRGGLPIGGSCILFNCDTAYLRDAGERNPQVGIYYFIKLPGGWHLAITSDPKVSDLGHPVLWENTLVPFLAKMWAQKLDQNTARLIPTLRTACYAFPRGRLAQVEGTAVIYHGGDAPYLNWKPRVRHALGVSACRFVFDDHERCQAFDRDAVCGLLSITYDWDAAN